MTQPFSGEGEHQNLTPVDSEQMRLAAEEIDSLSAKYGLVTRYALKRVALSLQREADRLQVEGE